jgi:hypothetical protein
MEQRHKTGDIGWETKYKDVREGTKDVRQGRENGPEEWVTRDKREKTQKTLRNDFCICSASE